MCGLLSTPILTKGAIAKTCTAATLNKAASLLAVPPSSVRRYDNPDGGPCFSLCLGPSHRQADPEKCTDNLPGPRHGSTLPSQQGGEARNGHAGALPHAVRGRAQANAILPRYAHRAHPRRSPFTRRSILGWLCPPAPASRVQSTARAPLHTACLQPYGPRMTPTPQSILPREALVRRAKRRSGTGVAAGRFGLGAWSGSGRARSLLGSSTSSTDLAAIVSNLRLVSLPKRGCPPRGKCPFRKHSNNAGSEWPERAFPSMMDAVQITCVYCGIDR